jgi:hypothetical protein
MLEMRDALVLRWDNQDTWIRCPYACDAKIHRHSTTLPEKDRPNSRIAHCRYTYDTNGDTEQKSITLVYPFETKKIATDLWWVLDRVQRCWRTVGWGIEDDEQGSESTPSDTSSQTERRASSPTTAIPGDVNDEADPDADELLSGLRNLNLEARRNNEEKIWFDTYCLNNDVASAKLMLESAEDSQALVREQADSGDKPILLMV